MAGANEIAGGRSPDTDVTGGERQPAIQTRGLGKSFGATRAIDGLDLEVEAGVVFGFLGPNGAGKTTLIRLLLDLIRPSQGQARVFGFDVNHESVEVRKRCGYLPGELKLPARSTAGQFLGHMARLRGGVEPERIQTLAEELGLDMERHLGELSKGNRQKVGLVSALMANPPLLILDEPTSGLDPLRQEDVKRLIRRHADAGGTVLLSSHALDEVEHVADRIGIIREGRLVALEDVSTLRDQAVRRVEIQFEDYGPSLDEIGGLEGVEIISSGDDWLELRVTGSMDALVKALATHTVRTINSSPPDLDNVFLSFYGDDDGH